VQFDAELDERCCGTHADVDLASARAVARILYDPPRHFQGLLERTLAQVRANGVTHAIVGLPAPFNVLPGRTTAIVTPLKDNVLRPICPIAFGPDALRVEAAVASSCDASPVPADALLWNVALWTARGRLRRGIALDTPVRLRRWPDFTRMTETPHAMRIAALLVGTPMTPRALCAKLAIPQRQVFSFLSAAASIGLVDRVARDGSARTAADTPAAAPPRPAAAERGLLARILGRLIAGH
jgi:hypothetical protein